MIENQFIIENDYDWKSEFSVSRDPSEIILIGSISHY